MDEKQAAEEATFRRVESAMAFLEDACRKLAEAAGELSTEGAPAHLVRATELAATSSKAAHRQLVRSVYYPSPADA
jgi:hypothetical protein